MNSHEIAELTTKAIEELAGALEAGLSEALTQYLAAMARFHKYSLLCVPQHNKLYVCCRTMLRRQSEDLRGAGCAPCLLT